MVTLDDLAVGEKAKILNYGSGDLSYRRRLLTMGLTPGTVLQVIGIAPLGDPVEIHCRGLYLCLRKQEARLLNLEKIIK